MFNTYRKTGLKSLLRPRGLFFLALLAGVSALFAQAGVDWALQQVFEAYATRLNGARVSVEHFNLSWFKGTGSLRTIEVAHHTNPMRNLLEIDEIHFTFDRQALLSTKLIIPELTVQGIRFDSPREQSGVIDSTDPSIQFSTALLDRVSPATYDHVRSSIGRNPIRNLGQLLLGFATRNAIEAAQRQFASLKELKAIETQFQSDLSGWEEAASKLSPRETQSLAIEEFDRETHRAETQIQKTHRQSQELLTRLDKVTQMLPQDVELVLKQLGLPHLGKEDFTRELLGRRILNYLERLAYWVDLSRRKMARVSSYEPGLFSREASPLGTAIRFSREEGLPRFLVRKAIFASKAGKNPHQGNIEGVLEDLSSDPVSHPHPMRLRLDAEFPAMRIRGLQLLATVDHTQTEPHEQVDFSISSFPLHNWSLEETPDLKIQIESANTSCAFQGDFNGPMISADWTVSIRDVDFNVSSRYSQLENTLRDAFPLTPSMNISGSVAGKNPDLELRITSNVGRRLASALGEKFQLPLRAAQESIREDLLDQISAPLANLRRRIERTQTQLTTRFTEAIESMDARKKHRG